MSVEDTNEFIEYFIDTHFGAKYKPFFRFFRLPRGCKLQTPGFGSLSTKMIYKLTIESTRNSCYKTWYKVGCKY